MNTKHTPGPWKAEGWKGIVVNDSNGHTLALAPGCSYSIEEMAANARLIAAAPDLLEALQNVIASTALPSAWSDDISEAQWQRQRLDECRDFARAAIAKATGETP